MKIIIMSGISGIGKSTAVRKATETLRAQGLTVTTVSADHHMVDEQGQYAFSPSKLGIAHRRCMQDFLRDASSGIDVVIVDNTNTTLHEISPYLCVGEALGRAVEVRFLTTEQPEEAWARNVHDVPRHVVLGQHARQQRTISSTPRHWTSSVELVRF